jgi:hypothetical protein
MDVDFLKQVEEFSNLKTALDTKKRNAFEKAKNMLVFAYEGGLFTADSNTILFAKTHDAKRDLIMLDNNNTPIKIADLQNFISKAESSYYEAMNEYYKVYEDLKTKRSVKKLMSDD